MLTQGLGQGTQGQGSTHWTMSLGWPRELPVQKVENVLCRLANQATFPYREQKATDRIAVRLQGHSTVHKFAPEGCIATMLVHQVKRGKVFGQGIEVEGHAVLCRLDGQDNLQPFFKILEARERIIAAERLEGGIHAGGFGAVGMPKAFPGQCFRIALYLKIASPLVFRHGSIELVHVAEKQIGKSRGQGAMRPALFASNHLFREKLGEQDCDRPRPGQEREPAARLEMLHVVEQLSFTPRHQIGLHERRQPLALDAQRLHDILGHIVQRFLATGNDNQGIGGKVRMSRMNGGVRRQARIHNAIHDDQNAALAK